jgi:hypothetical protein
VTANLAAMVQREPLIEPAVPACSCWVCRNRDKSNMDVIALHAQRHYEFSEWLAARSDVTFKKPSLRAALQRRAEEWTVPTGRCEAHPGQPSHPVHP